LFSQSNRYRFQSSRHARQSSRAQSPEISSTSLFQIRVQNSFQVLQENLILLIVDNSSPAPGLYLARGVSMKRMPRLTLQLASFAAAGLLAAALSAPQALAQVGVGVYIGRTPPPLRYEARPPIPGPGYVWIDGFYEPWQGGYRWHPGYWNRPPYEGAYWVHPHYDHYDRGWAYHEGFWAHEDHGGYRQDGFRDHH
jgi:hypothetical protein